MYVRYKRERERERLKKEIRRARLAMGQRKYLCEEKKSWERSLYAGGAGIASVADGVAAFSDFAICFSVASACPDASLV